MVLLVGAKLSKALKLCSHLSEGVPGENIAPDTPLGYKWELTAGSVLATDVDADSGEEHAVLRITDTVVGTTSAFQRISFSEEDRRRGEFLFVLHIHSLYIRHLLPTPL